MTELSARTVLQIVADLYLGQPSEALETELITALEDYIREAFSES
jgi:hypothetical protein